MEYNFCQIISYMITFFLFGPGIVYYTYVTVSTEDGFEFLSPMGVPMLIIVMAFIFMLFFSVMCAPRIKIFSICEPNPNPDLPNGLHRTTEKCKLTDCEIISIVLLVFMDVGFIFHYYNFAILCELHKAETNDIIYLVIFIIVLIVATIFTFFGASRIKKPIFRGHHPCRPEVLRIIIERAGHQQVTERAGHQQVTEESDEIYCCRISRLFRRSPHPEPTDDIALGPIPPNAVHRDRQPDFPIPID